MWGSTFSDFAKKAQELQEQASEAASSLATTNATAGLFNLDEMRQGEETSKPPPKVPDHERPVIGGSTSPTGTKTTLKSMDRAISPVAPAVPVQVKTPPTGKLKVPPPKAPAPSGKLKFPSTKTEEQSQATAEAKDDAAPEEGEGWDDEDDMVELDLDEDKPIESGETNLTASSTEDVSQRSDHHAAENEGAKDVTVTQTEATPIDSQVDKGLGVELSTENGQNVKAAQHENSVVSELIVREPPGAEADEANKHSVDTAGMNGVQHDTVSQLQSENQGPSRDEALQADDESEKDHSPEVGLATDVEGSSPQEPPEEESHPEVETEDDPLERKLLVLVSSQPLDRKVSSRQERAFTVMDAKGIPYEKVDGADPSKKILRDELFGVSGLRGVYPQFFFVCLPDGSATFWGDYDRFESVNDEGALSSELLVEDTSATGSASQASQADADNEFASPESQGVVHEQLLEQFSQQLQRLEENFQAERLATEKKHAEEMEKLKVSLNHDKCLKQAREMEKQLVAEIKERDERIHDLGRSNEGYKLKLDVLKREVEGTQQLLEARDSDMGKVSEAHSRNLQTLEEKVRQAEARDKVSRQESDMMKKSLENTKSELEASIQEHTDLKARVKVVAGELKDRRVECRELSAKVDELTETNEALRSNLDSLQSRVFDQDRSQSEKHEEIEQLRAKLVDAASEREKLLLAGKEREKQAEKTLVEYKKKAQSSLALANSRTAAAIQAKEEAELEARAARSTSDSAMERAVKAEISSKEALAEAKIYVKDMEREKAQVQKELEEIRETQLSTEDRLAKSQDQFDQCLSAKDRLSDELKQALSGLEAEKRKVATLEADLQESYDQANGLRDDVATLRDQLQYSESAIASSTDETAKEAKEAPAPPVENGPEKPSDDATIMSLQHELSDAKEAIEDLKEALKNALENEATALTGPKSFSDESNRSPAHISNGGNESTPLFFAMEKQAELKTARNEIQRLANLLADVQSEKMEAHEAMENMRKRMEEAEARLQRFEKLSSAPGRSPSVSGNQGLSMSMVRENQGEGPATSGAVNIEYLKNIMLSYLNARTLAERKALVPVIGAVLCLTADEQKHALENLEESGSLGGVSTSLLESLTGMYSG